MGKVSGGARRQGARPPEGGRGRTVRLQLHLSTETAQRLGVHCSIVFRDKSRVADEVLSAWLRRYGRGAESFDPGEIDDRRGGAPGVSDSGAEDAA